MEYILLITVLLLLIYTFHKVRRIHLMLYNVKNQLQELSNKGLDNLFNQLEALNSLYLDLDFKKSLPPTRGWYASPDILFLIANHVLSKKPKVVVECGSGVSTLILARSLQINSIGHVYSLEHLTEYAQETQTLLKKHGLSEWATVINAPLKAYEMKEEAWPWYFIEKLPQTGIDMLVIDGPPGDTRPLARYPAGPFLFNRLNIGAFVFLDDANRSDEKEILKIWKEEHPDLKQEVSYCEKGCAILDKVRNDKV